MKVVAIIPSRYGSTRFDGKPLELIKVKVREKTLIKPMIQWTYGQANKSDSVSDVLVATDDDRIIKAVESFGGRAVLTSDQNRSGTDRVGEAAELMGLCDDDIVVNIQGDQPAFCPISLNQVVAPFYNNPELEMSTLAFITHRKDEITEKKECKVTFNRKGYALYFSRSPIPCTRDGDTETAYKHLGIYAYTKRFLDVFRNLDTGILEDIEKLEQLRALEHGHHILVVETPYDSPEVDRPKDIPRIENYMSANQEILSLNQ